ncbi:hypothetical protein OBBRIDRAFT_778110 [Obba rivulosa]|uniref:Fe2OG dioxygenase domain-containing protein n=1 Tax=Obba rivulosa TaxID=1052685 RepID=A0A8E2AX74_9APHY|nr:hypothetical protein OBBRIDRAFT_778110 [Obba rivulosa]
MTFGGSSGDATTSVDDQVEALQNAIAASSPFCHGCLDVWPHELTLYYGDDENIRRIELSYGRMEEELRRLFDASEPATFKRDSQDVLDETLMKAGKLHIFDFANKFDPTASRMLSLIRGELLESGREEPISAELRELNVYGPGSFSKSYKETQRNEDCFATLVLIYPTKHEGGELVLDRDGEQWVIDIANAISHSAESNNIHYVAFLNDVAHEILPIRSGYRVAVTYELFFTPDPDVTLNAECRTASRGSPPNKKTMEAALQALLRNADSPLNNGGYLGFGLRHRYPFSGLKPWDLDNDLELLQDRLKGCDATILQICEDLELDVSLKAIVKLPEADVIIDYIPSVPEVITREEQKYGSLVPYFIWSDGGRILGEVRQGARYKEKWYMEPVTWITPYTNEANVLKAPRALGGDEVSLHWVPIHICLLAKIRARENGNGPGAIAGDTESQDDMFVK